MGAGVGAENWASNGAKSLRGVKEARLRVTVPESVLASEAPVSRKLASNVTLTSCGKRTRTFRASACSRYTSAVPESSAAPKSRLPVKVMVPPLVSAVSFSMVARFRSNAIDPSALSIT